MQNLDRRKSDFRFVLGVIGEISESRKNFEMIVRCNIIESKIEDLGSLNEQDVSNIKTDIINIMDELRFIIDTEKRYILFPIPDIKEQAYELGEHYMKNFFDWITQEDNYSKEDILKILEDELYKMQEVKEILPRI